MQITNKLLLVFLPKMLFQLKLTKSCFLVQLFNKHLAFRNVDTNLQLV